MSIPKITDLMTINEYFFEWVPGYYKTDEMWEIHHEEEKSMWKIRRKGTKDEWEEFNEDTHDEVLNRLKINLNDFLMKLYAVNIMHAGGLHYKMEQYKKILGEDEVTDAAKRWEEFKGMLVKSISPLLEDPLLESNEKSAEAIKKVEKKMGLTIVKDNNDE